MAEVDTLGILRRIHDDQLRLHDDLHEKSSAHRAQHGEDCTVYPSSPANGTLWPLLGAMVQARRFLEIGCGLGYTAALMAEAGGAHCRVDTIEAVEEHAALAEAEFSRKGLTHQIRVIRGRARGVLPGLSTPYDVVFVDAGWNEYPDMLPHLLRLTRPGGVLITANLFPLFEEWAQEMHGQEAIEAYLIALARDPRFRTHIIPEQWHAISYRLS